MSVESFTIGIDANENYAPTFPGVLRVSPYVDKPARLVKLKLKVARYSAPTRKKNPFNWGDYCTPDHKVNGKCLAGIDKKGSPYELYNNLAGPPRERARFLRSLDLFAESVEYAYFWLDMNWTDLWEKAPSFSKRSSLQIDPEPIWQAFLHEITQRNIGLLGPTGAGGTKQRMQAGHFIALRLYTLCHPRPPLRSTLSPCISPQIIRESY